ncbi:hypothetical protein VN97_g1940 [Penicillium thymicola]|uniref:Uncharacterized protein n=1 Tax=Penicillium thymicola TaxID=293382 RepID=A0AAI9XBK9_PENTH|nr:hypothetical protein VN97_g1940 [Penicillium thymicola]
MGLILRWCLESNNLGYYISGADKSNRLFHLSNSLPFPSGQRSELARTAVQSAEHHSADAVVGPSSHQWSPTNLIY